MEMTLISQDLNTKRNTDLTMELSIKAIGKTICDTAKVLKYGLMEQDTKDFGEKIRLMEKGNSGMLMETFLRVNGRMTRQMDTEYTHI